MYDHEQYAASSGAHSHTRKSRTIRKIWQSGGEVQYTVVLVTNDEQEAFNEEARIIAAIGRDILCNHTNGGEGVSGRIVPIEERISRSNKVREAWQNPDLRKQQSERHKTRLTNPIERQKHIERFQEMISRPDVRQKIGHAVTERYKDPEERQRQRERSTQAWSDPNLRKEQSDRQKQRGADPEERKKRSERRIQFLANPEERQRVRDRGIERYRDPEERQKQRLISREIWTRPGYRDQVSNSLREYYKDTDNRNERARSQRQAQATRKGDVYRPFWYRCVSPTGEVFLVENLKMFCDEHGLGNANMYKVAQGKAKQNLGWTVTRQYQDEEANPSTEL